MADPWVWEEISSGEDLLLKGDRAARETMGPPEEGEALLDEGLREESNPETSAPSVQTGFAQCALSRGAAAFRRAEGTQMPEGDPGVCPEGRQGEGVPGAGDGAPEEGKLLGRKKSGGRSFAIGFFTTLCISGLLMGFLTVDYFGRKICVNDSQPVFSLEQEENGRTFLHLYAFGQKERLNITLLSETWQAVKVICNLDG